jgi:hypothetical protein
MEENEKEYEYGNINNNQHNNYKVEISLLSIKSGLEDSKIIHSIKNDKSIHLDNKSLNKLNNIISEIHKNDNNNNNNIINNKNSIFDYADKLYNSDEHLSKIELIKSKNSRENFLNINHMSRPQSIDKNFEKKTSLSKNDANTKIFRKSLFHSKMNKKEEDKDNQSKKHQSSNSKNVSYVENKSKEKNNNSNNKIIAAFLKLKEKNKRPPKISYLDSLINNTNNSKLNSSIKKNNIRKPSLKTFSTNKVLKKNRTFSCKKEVIINKKERKNQEQIHLLPNNKKMNLEDMNVKDSQNTENLKNNFKRINWPRIKFLCCLNCN